MTSPRSPYEPTSTPPAAGPDGGPPEWLRNPVIIGLGILALLLVGLLIGLSLAGGGDESTETTDSSTTSLLDTTTSESSAPESSVPETTASTDPTTTEATSTTSSTSTTTTTSTTSTTTTTTAAPEPVPDVDDFLAARARWNAYRDSAPGGVYNLDYRTGVGFHVCAVVNGDQVVPTAFEDDCNEDGYDGLCAQCGIRTIDDLFDTIEGFIRNDVAAEVRYHPDDGYPRYIEALDCPPDDPDCGFQITMGIVGQGTGD